MLIFGTIRAEPLRYMIHSIAEYVTYIQRWHSSSKHEAYKMLVYSYVRIDSGAAWMLNRAYRYMDWYVSRQLHVDI
jgi:hypothetical protein